MDKRDIDFNDIKEADSINVKTLSNLLWVDVFWGDWKESFQMNNSYRNRVMFDRDKFSINGKSLYEILFGNKDRTIQLCEDPSVSIKPAQFDNTYKIWYNNDFVVTTSEQSEAVIKGIEEIIENNNPSVLKGLVEEIKQNIVNIPFFTKLYKNGELDSSIERAEDGFVIDDFFLLTWRGKFYEYTSDWKDGCFSPGGKKKDRPGQLREISVDIDEDKIENVKHDGREYELKELDYIFMKRINWVVNWEENFDDAEVESIKRTLPILQEHDI